MAVIGIQFIDRGPNCTIVCTVTLAVHSAVSIALVRARAAADAATAAAAVSSPSYRRDMCRIFAVRRLAGRSGRGACADRRAGGSVIGRDRTLRVLTYFREASLICIYVDCVHERRLFICHFVELIGALTSVSSPRCRGARGAISFAVVVVNSRRLARVPPAGRGNCR